MQEVAEAAEVVEQPADVGLVLDLGVQRPRALGVVARRDPVALALGDQRSLEVDVSSHALVLEPFGELERALDVFARCLVIALAAPAARAPVEDLRAQKIAREPRALRELESLVEQRDCRRDARKLVAADAEAEEDVRAIDVGEPGPSTSVRARASSSIASRTSPTSWRAQASTAEEPNLEVGRARDEDRGARVLDLLERLLALVRRGQCLGAREHRLDPAALVGRDTVLQEVGVDAQPLREPLDRLARRARLAALDLAHVLLAEARAGEVGLGQSRGDAELADAVA